MSTPKWCPEQQIYLDGKLPENPQVKALLEKNGGSLRLFGYGSLCWNPGTGALAKEEVVAKSGRARGYKRCWAQKSTDHRGNPKFPGIVCTLLEDGEVHQIQKFANAATKEVGSSAEPTMTEGVIYLIPPELVQECLEELDFREKGGYARETITVVENETGDIHEALLYRGTPDNPAMWNRALLDLPFAAAIISVSEGPSGKNDFYLNSLDDFLKNTRTVQTENDDTTLLASMARAYQNNNQLYFLYGSGSNQHNQLLLNRPNNAACLINGEDAHEKKEIVLCTPRGKGEEPERVKEIYAGGGHSALLTQSGLLYLWGWNEDGQCGQISSGNNDLNPNPSIPIPAMLPFSNITVEKAALGFSHTLIIEKETNRVFVFGNNERGQVNGKPSTKIKQEIPKTPEFLVDEEAHAIAAGLFHSAVITKNGELITFGCGRFGQSLSNLNTANDDGRVWIGRWKPDDGTPLVQVACGRRHTITVDKKGRIWSFGENKYGQLGRPVNGKKDPVPGLVGGVQPSMGGVVEIDCGWSHTIVCLKESPEDSRLSKVFGWGRNDKGQLGLTGPISSPVELFKDKNLSSIACGSESTMVVEEATNDILGCGWNEHGNLATRSQNDRQELTKALGAKVVGPPGLHDGKVIVAVGGAHFFASKVT